MKIQDVSPREVSITLSEYEALVLMALLERVGGPPSGPRGVIDAIYSGLYALGLNHDLFTECNEGQVYFQ